MAEGNNFYYFFEALSSKLSPRKLLIARKGAIFTEGKEELARGPVWRNESFIV